ncbi:tyrosine-protein kinase BAZ1B-like [Scleropages formosus]|uniref:Tyrosine-protein kinase BAZ1B-like n=1 Tax=Scleropages formosus TaxID=113540 RepID=A0A0N8K056_SCLFO|nr:tyrosine-protein kinase BAZ1B-like [Scleropages formosus]
MAPLLGRKPFPLAKPLAEPPGPGEELYIVEHTKEAFTNKEEYEARLKKYNERIWTCKSTGSSQLTHKEAWEEEQEVTELLQEEFPCWFEKPVLEMVHHNTLSLDKLVDQAWVEIFTKYAVEEEPEDEAIEKKLEGTCDSPSSDKENSSQENQKKEVQPKGEENKRDSICDRARRSPRKLPTSLKEEKRKWVMPKFLPHKYDVKLINEDKIISNVPVDSLFRTERPPNKEIMRYFIRHYALRLGVGESAPWVVEDELVKKYNLPSKYSDFLLDPYKYMADNPSTKRKSLSSEGKPPKKLKTAEASTEGEVLSEKGVKKKKQKNLPLSLTIWDHMQKKVNSSPLKVKNTGTPKKTSGEDVKVNKKQCETKKSKKNGTKAINGQKASKKDEKGAKKPKMKQMTLLDMAKSSSSSSPKKRTKSTGPGTPKLAKPLPPMALHLLRYYKENKGKEEKKNALSSLISKAAKVLSAEDRGRLPEELRDMVEKRSELLEQKRRWAAMSEEEKQDVMRKKREEIKEKLRERAKERREKEMLVRLEQQRRFEDQELEGKSLPKFKLVDMPEGLPNTLFGDIAMVADFLNCYSGLLMPDDQYPITAASLMEALAAEKGGFLYLNRVLVILLQTLLQDELAEGYSELDMPLSEIPLTMHSVSELVRLCLRPSDSHGEDSGQGSEDWALGGLDDAVSAEFLEKLETAEVFELSPQEKVGLLVALCHRILMTYSVENHVDAMQQRSAELWKERLASLKEANDRRRAEKQRHKEEMEAKDKKEASSKKDASKAKTVPPPSEPQVEDLISTVKSRRLMAIQAKKEKEEMERLNKERMEKEAEELRVRKQKAAAERAFQEGITKAKLVLRRVPLGTDRNHNRYWLFSDVVPGLYIEKGWVHESIDYSFTLPPEEEEDEEQEEDDGEEADKEECGTEGGQQGAQVAPETIETTVPNRGQNLWFVCDTQLELEELMESLHPQGVRESELKTHLQFRYQDVLHSIHLARKASPRLKTCDGHEELLKYLRSDILEVASRLQKGGLGYMDDISEFEEKVRCLENLKDFGECVITLQESVIKKFLQGFMAPKQKKKKKKQGGEESNKAEEVDEEKKLAEEARVATAVEKWKMVIREAQTFSRMHVLLGMLDACIKWDMSAENARCKVCRRKETIMRTQKMKKRRIMRILKQKMKRRKMKILWEPPGTTVRQTSRTGSRRQAVELEKCEELLHKLVKFRYSWPFREPVSPEEAEDYLDIITHPMDFQTMLRKFSDGQYRHGGDFLEDMKLVFSNAEEYNQPGSTVLSCLAKTEQTFVDLLHKLVPGLSYVRRRPRKRPVSEAESEEEQEEAECSTRRGRASRTTKQGEESKNASREAKRRSSGSGQEDAEESRCEEEEEEDVGVIRRKSKRAAAIANRKDYREVESDSEQEMSDRRRRAGRGRPLFDQEDEVDSRRTRNRQSKGVEVEGSDEDRPSLRHSKRDQPDWCIQI